VPLVLLERSWWCAGFNGIYWVRFGFKMWEILILKWFLPLKIQINSKKPGFGKKNQLRTCGNTWAKGKGHTIILYNESKHNNIVAYQGKANKDDIGSGIQLCSSVFVDTLQQNEWRYVSHVISFHMIVFSKCVSCLI